MQIKEMDIKINGKSCRAKLLFIDESDRPTLKTLFDAWKQLFLGMRNFRSRGINMPEGISESAFALEANCPRVLSTNADEASFDNFDLKTNKRLQIKATSVENDLTSFGPDSVWDELYWLDFYRDGKLDGTFDVYKIPNNLIYNFKVNANQTFKQQQMQRRRPRLRMRHDIIMPNGIKPIKTFKI